MLADALLIKKILIRIKVSYKCSIQVIPSVSILSEKRYAVRRQCVSRTNIFQDGLMLTPLIRGEKSQHLQNQRV